MVTHQNDFWNLSALLMGVVTLFFTIEDRRNKKIIDTYDSISRAIREVKLELGTEMQHRDSLHDQQIIKLTTDISILNLQLELHSKETGHKGLLEEVFRIKDDISGLNANVVQVTQQGRIMRQLERVKNDNARLEQLVQGLMTKNVDLIN